MCQLFALTSPQPVSPDFSLRGFFQRGGKTGDHCDGWGLALFRNHEIDLQTYCNAAHICEKATAILQAKPRATTALAHIRKATEGAVALQNSHPFMRSLWGETWVFAHNGTLRNFYPELPSGFQPLGQTDSERAFNFIFSQLAKTFPVRPNLSVLANFLHEQSSFISRFGVFNYLLSNGSLLIAHCSTELYWTHRRHPFGKVELLDIDISIDLDEINAVEETMYVIATKPLTRGEPWSPMGQGEMRIFESGRMVFEIPPVPARGSHRLDWNGGWQANRIVLS